MLDKLLGQEVDRTGSELCPVAGFDLSGIESSGLTTVVLVSLIIWTVFYSCHLRNEANICPFREEYLHHLYK
jgi:hypothetical protein